MGFRFRKQIRLAPGIRLNISKSGPSLTLGTRGANINLGGTRGTTATIGIPGSGFHYTTSLGGGKKNEKAKREAEKARNEAPEDKLNLSFFERLKTGDNEEAFVDGLKAYLDGDAHSAKLQWEKADGIADAQFLAGIVALGEGDFASARADLEAALAKQNELGKHLQEYEVELAVDLPVTEDVEAHVQSDVRGVRLALVEAFQGAGMLNEAVAQLEALLAMQPDSGDVVTRLSLAELRYEAAPTDPANMQAIVKLAEGVTNETYLHAALMLYRAKALRQLGLLTAARDTVTDALRKKKDVPDELLWALRYERILIYEADGEKAKARAETEKLYAEAPGYEDLAERLNL